MNLPLLVEVINTITQNPSCWDQRSWHCGTQHCFFGHAQILGGRTQNAETAYQDGKELLGLSEADATWLSHADRTLHELHQFAECAVRGESYFDADGYNREGYDRKGYDRYGYDRDGYGHYGYDRGGYNRAGYDRAGYNRAGYDRTGYNREGRDRDGTRLPLLSVRGYLCCRYRCEQAS